MFERGMLSRRPDDASYKNQLENQSLFKYSQLIRIQIVLVFLSCDYDCCEMIGRSGHKTHKNAIKPFVTIENK